MSELETFREEYLRMLDLDPLPDPRARVERDGPVVRHISDEGSQSFLYLVFLRAPCPSSDFVRAAVERETRLADSRGRAFQWKMLEFPDAPGLENTLKEYCFVPTRPARLLYLPVARELADERPEIEVVPLRERAGFDALHALAEEVSGPGPRTLADILLREANEPEPRTHVLAARIEGRMVAGAWIKVYGRVGYLFGGMTHPEHRGRGAYRALVHARHALARSLGLRYLVTDANDRSGPILRKLGFEDAGRNLAYVCARD